jgi:hypothetical protein
MGRPEVVWPMRRSPLVRAVIGWVARASMAMLVVVAAITLFFVWAFGHPVAWSVVGLLFGAAPLAMLLAAVALGIRGAVAAGPQWVGVRFLGRWRVMDLGQVRVVRLSGSPLGAMRGWSGVTGFGGFAGAGGGPGRRGPGGGGGAGAPAGSLVFEDAWGRRVDIGVDALNAGMADVVRAGLSSDAEVDPDAARALGSAQPSEGDDTGA